MNFQNDRYTLRFADSNDNQGMKEMFDSCSFSGGISVQYLRSNTPYESFLADGNRSHMLIVLDNQNAGRVVGIGGAIVREEYVSGIPQKCAYLTGLKIHPDYRRKIAFIPQAYQYLHKRITDCDYCYTTILDENEAAIKLLEKQHRNMPKYTYLGHYTTYCFHGGASRLPLEKDNLQGLDELMQSHFSKFDLTPVDYHCVGFGQTQFFSYREQGEIIACCFVGNQQALKQYKMCNYAGIYKLVSKLPTKLLGYPAFPPSGSIINHGVVSYLYIKDNDKKLCADFLRSVAAQADYSLLLWGGMEDNPLCAALDHMKTIHYGSRLYCVEWDNYFDNSATGSKPMELSGVLGVEVALL